MSAHGVVESAPAHVQSCPARVDLQEREIRGLIAALAKARAVAFEEWLAHARKTSDSLGMDGLDFAQFVSEMREKASSPPSGQWVSADVMEKVKSALMSSPPPGCVWNCDGPPDHALQQNCACGATDKRRKHAAALSALESEASR